MVFYRSGDLVIWFSHFKISQKPDIMQQFSRLDSKSAQKNVQENALKIFKPDKKLFYVDQRNLCTRSQPTM